MKKKVLIITILFIILMLPKNIFAVASTFGDLLDELERLEKQAETEKQQKQMNQAEYNTAVNDLKVTQDNIANCNNQITEASNKIKELEEEIEKKQEETNNILVFLQISNGESSYLEYIFKAKSFTDLIHRVSVVEQISKYNKELVKEMNDLIKQNQDLKVELANKVAELETMVSTYQSKIASLGTQLKQLDEDAADTEDLIASQKQIIKTYQDKGCSERSDLLSSCMGIPESKYFMRPFDRGQVTSDYGYRIHPTQGIYKFHNGIDISDTSIEGRAIYPVANGVVVAMTEWSCGGKVIFIHHLVNGVKYTSVYEHLLNFGNVKIGDVVSTNDVIGYVGGWSTITKNGGYDQCSTGAHLHLTICLGYKTAATYYSSTIDPTTVIYFPKAYGWFYGRSW